MKVRYDADIDAVYIQLGNQQPDGVVELPEGVNLDTTMGHKIVGIEILDASKKMDINSLLSDNADIKPGARIHGHSSP